MKINTKGHKLKWLFCGGAKLDENIRKSLKKNIKLEYLQIMDLQKHPL